MIELDQYAENIISRFEKNVMYVPVLNIPLHNNELAEANLKA